MSGQIQPIGAPIRPIGPAMPVAHIQTVTITPKEILGIIRRHIWLIIIFTLLGLMVGGALFFVMKRYFPKYTAMTAIEVLEPGIEDPTTFRGSIPNKDILYQHRQTKAAYIKQQSTLQDLLQRDKIRETDWFKSFGENEAERIIDAVENLKKNLSVGAQRESNWITISMTCGSKKESALIVNEMVDLFLTTQREAATRDLNNQLSEHISQRDSIQNDLEIIEQNLNTIRLGTNFANLSQISFRDYMDTRIADLEIRLSESNSDIARLEGQIAYLKKRAEGEYDEVVREQTERDPIASNMRRIISNLEVQLASLLARFGEDHRQVRDTRDALKRANLDLAKRQAMIGDLQRRSNQILAEDELTALIKQQEINREQLAEARNEYKNLGMIRTNYQRVEKLRDEKRALLEERNSHIEKVRMILDDPEIAKVKPVGNAPEPLQMSSPKMYIYIPAGFIFGLMAGVGLAFLIELLNDLLRTPSDIRKYLKVPLLGMICHEDEDEDTEGVDLCHVVRQAPYSIMSENYRQLKTNLKLTGSGIFHKSLFVTSSNASDGKTTVAMNLATTFVSEDKKVLFIDANFRRPTSSVMFPRTEENGSVLNHVDFGLSNYLMGQCDYEDLIRYSGMEDLDIIDSGPLPSHPSELLGSGTMITLLEKVCMQYDHVIIDGPALLVSDAKTLSSLSDATLLVFNASLTRRGAAQRVMRELNAINANVIGSVLLGVKSIKGGYFHEIYESYQEYQQVHAKQPI